MSLMKRDARRDATVTERRRRDSAKPSIRKRARNTVRWIEGGGEKP